jgi:hypothetical protein
MAFSIIEEVSDKCRCITRTDNRKNRQLGPNVTAGENCNQHTVLIIYHIVAGLQL